MSIHVCSDVLHGGNSVRRVTESAEPLTKVIHPNGGVVVNA
ncbi:MAG TPA: hypothetical protein VK470_03495 [Bacteroidota bacterium]|nr:hypothetical protein [Bacteroidota bacterium]